MRKRERRLDLLNVNRKKTRGEVKKKKVRRTVKKEEEGEGSKARKGR